MCARSKNRFPIMRVSLPHVGYNAMGSLERADCTRNANFCVPGLGITRYQGPAWRYRAIPLQ